MSSKRRSNFEALWSSSARLIVFAQSVFTSSNPLPSSPYAGKGDAQCYINGLKHTIFTFTRVSRELEVVYGISQVIIHSFSCIRTLAFPLRSGKQNSRGRSTQHTFLIGLLFAAERTRNERVCDQAIRIPRCAPYRVARETDYIMLELCPAKRVEDSKTISKDKHKSLRPPPLYDQAKSAVTNIPSISPVCPPLALEQHQAKSPYSRSPGHSLSVIFNNLTTSLIFKYFYLSAELAMSPPPDNPALTVDRSELPNVSNAQQKVNLAILMVPWLDPRSTGPSSVRKSNLILQSGHIPARLACSLRRLAKKKMLEKRESQQTSGDEPNVERAVGQHGLPTNGKLTVRAEPLP
ncbi:uncharacterized protein FOMMEDRAFT_160671 [Fomitiporia mediterranea MF3/22]|uniref:uncharacterized protein n=1 Tax=Fomitiporia mediterranea (strain MF3/22) TaxID=694068 RepID=UPI0004407E40|nr:uncharacterized protein FOMMEDRAFT_160671 [Fomitiporia mediterranea MF3/22]EJC99111.1 hypothetical protein FOMMEDRAFT_160671 [Fomitiporia mediterranea MF3/22]